MNGIFVGQIHIIVLRNICVHIVKHSGTRGRETGSERRLLRGGKRSPKNQCAAFVCICRDVGLPRPGPDAPEVPVHADGPRGGAGGAPPALEVAADAAEQRGQTLPFPNITCTEHSLSFVGIVFITTRVTGGKWACSQLKALYRRERNMAIILSHTFKDERARSSTPHAQGRRWKCIHLCQ